MKIKIEIDVQPEELRRFLGVPDVAGIQEDIVEFIRDKIAADPAGFVIDNLQRVGKSRPVRRLLYGTGASRRPRHGGNDNPE